MEILVLIDKLDDLMRNARPVPLTDQVRVDKEAVLDILDHMRGGLPEELRAARHARPAAGVDQTAINAAVSAAIRESIPEIARATAAAIGSGRPPAPPAPGGPF